MVTGMFVGVDLSRVRLPPGRPLLRVWSRHVPRGWTQSRNHPRGSTHRRSTGTPGTVRSPSTTPVRVSRLPHRLSVLLGRSSDAPRRTESTPESALDGWVPRVSATSSSLTWRPVVLGPLVTGRPEALVWGPGLTTGEVRRSTKAVGPRGGTVTRLRHKTRRVARS